jgi:FMN reductase (NADPH)
MAVSPMEPLSRMEPVLEVFERHRTVRNYTAEKIPQADIARICAGGRRAPSDATGFMYTIIRVRDHAKRVEIERLSGSNPHIIAASDLFVVCLDFHRQAKLLRHLGATPAPLGIWSVLFGVTDAILVAQNMALAAEALRYGTGFIGGVQKDAAGIARVLGCPKGVFPVVGLTMGVIERYPDPRKRLPLKATFHEDTYHDLSEAELAQCFETMRSTTGKFDWSASIKRYFAEGGEMHQREPTIRRGLTEQGLLNNEAEGD